MRSRFLKDSLLCMRSLHGACSEEASMRSFLLSASCLKKGLSRELLCLTFTDKRMSLRPSDITCFTISFARPPSPSIITLGWKRPISRNMTLTKCRCTFRHFSTQIAFSEYRNCFNGGRKQTSFICRHFGTRQRTRIGLS